MGREKDRSHRNENEQGNVAAYQVGALLIYGLRK